MNIDLTLYKDQRAPHCDPRVLHARGECEICDEYAVRAQADRISKGINFTGHSEKGLTTCPADEARGLGKAHKWYGNRPYNEVWNK